MQARKDHSHGEAAAALRWLAGAGVDVILADHPHNRLTPPSEGRNVGAPSPAASPSFPSSDVGRKANASQQALSASGSETSAPASGLSQVAEAERLAADCADLQALREALSAFDGCALKNTATQLVFADGNADAPLMIIGEAPGRAEDEKGLPFVGAAGQLLDKILAASGLARQEVYITNVVPWRPPGNRKPTPLEVQICMPFMLRHIALAAPQMLLLLGGTPASALTESSQGITRLRGRWHDVSITPDNKIAAMATFHPAYLLRQPAHKALVWQDMLTLKAKLDT